MNIILVIFDSLRKDCIGCYNAGEPGSPPWGWKVKTPHLDALSEESLLMTRAYPESLPTLPARRAIYTGKRVYPFHNARFKLQGDLVGAARAPGWETIVTVIDDNQWLNCKVNGSGVLLYDLNASVPFEKNVADEHCDVAERMFKLALNDAKEGVHDYLIEMAGTEEDAPGCSELALGNLLNHKGDKK